MPGGRPRLYGDEPCSIAWNVRLPPSLDALLRSFAEEHDFSMAEGIRQAVALGVGKVGALDSLDRCVQERDRFQAAVEDCQGVVKELERKLAKYSAAVPAKAARTVAVSPPVRASEGSKVPRGEKCRHPAGRRVGDHCMDCGAQISAR